jgi:hypothetical protein
MSGSGGAGGAAPAKRTAVLVVHGMGNQRPLETLRGIVKAIWTTDHGLGGADPKHWVHIKRVESRRERSDADLPVITTSGMTITGRQIDFHEFYWAHVMAETRLAAVLIWLFEFVRKGAAPMRRDIRLFWFLAVPYLIATVVAVAVLLGEVARWLLGGDPVDLGVALIVPWVLALVFVFIAMGIRGVLVLVFLFAIDFAISQTSNPGAEWTLLGRLGHDASTIAAIAIVAIFAAIGTVFLTSVFGDAARYYRNSPANIRARREIRGTGRDMLDALNRDQRYDRVIIVAHSLGSTIAYDILRTYWAEACRTFKNVAGLAEIAAQDAVTGSGTTVVVAGDPPQTRMTPADRVAWRSRARRVVNELNLHGATLPASDPTVRETPRWLVTDFVTIGSPLHHARYLKAAGTNVAELRDNFAQRLRDRELPQNPAIVDAGSGDGTMTFADPTAPGQRRLHHAGLFGATRWTNLFFPAGIINGDFFGGPLQHAFGQGIEDIALDRGHAFRLLWHTSYWTLGANDAVPGYVLKLREAINLGEP